MAGHNLPPPGRNRVNVPENLGKVATYLTCLTINYAHELAVSRLRNHLQLCFLYEASCTIVHQGAVQKLPRLAVIG